MLAALAAAVAARSPAGAARADTDWPEDHLWTRATGQWRYGMVMGSVHVMPAVWHLSVRMRETSGTCIHELSLNAQPKVCPKRSSLSPNGRFRAMAHVCTHKLQTNWQAPLRSTTYLYNRTKDSGTYCGSSFGHPTPHLP